YRFAYDETLANTETTIGGAQHPAFEVQLAGTRSLVLTDLRAASAKVEVDADVRGRLTFRNRDGRVTAELDKHSGDAVTLAIPPGSYEVTAIDRDAAYRAKLRTGRGKTRLRRTDFVSVPRTDTTLRGSNEATGYRVVPFNLSLFPPASINTIARPNKVENRVSINLFAGSSDRLHGFEFGLGPNIVRDDARGVQSGVVGSYVGRDFRGIQTGVGFGFVRGTMTGVQQALGFSYARGVQGVQLALVNVAGDVRGGQLGLLNIATRRVTGAQVGVINYAGDVAGASLGPVSAVKSGRVRGDTWTSDAGLVHAGLRLRGRNTYSLLMAGIYPLGQAPTWSLGAAIGGHVPLTRMLHLDADVGWQMVHPGYRFDTQIDSLLQVRVMLGVRPHTHFGVYAGPTLNVFIPTYDASILVLPGKTARPGYGPNFVVAQGPNFHVAMWPGFVLGFEI
ncbi:MAG: LA_2272 family surface repeat-containing protein, partial [Nannocystaceae bacterium]